MTDKKCDNLLFQHILHTIAKQQLEKLKEEKELIELYQSNGYSFEETAQAMGWRGEAIHVQCPDGTVERV